MRDSKKRVEDHPNWPKASKIDNDPSHWRIWKNGGGLFNISVENLMSIFEKPHKGSKFDNHYNSVPNIRLGQDVIVSGNARFRCGCYYNLDQKPHIIIEGNVHFYENAVIHSYSKIVAINGALKICGKAQVCGVYVNSTGNSLIGGKVDLSGTINGHVRLTAPEMIYLRTGKKATTTDECYENSVSYYTKKEKKHGLSYCSKREVVRLYKNSRTPEKALDYATQDINE